MKQWNQWQRRRAVAGTLGVVALIAGGAAWAQRGGETGGATAVMIAPPGPPGSAPPPPIMVPYPPCSRVVTDRCEQRQAIAVRRVRRR